MDMVVRETWRTVAMATAGVTLALVLAIPLSLMATRVFRCRLCRAAWTVGLRCCAGWCELR